MEKDYSKRELDEIKNFTMDKLFAQYVCPEQVKADGKRDVAKIYTKAAVICIGIWAGYKTIKYVAGKVAQCYKIRREKKG